MIQAEVEETPMETGAQGQVGVVGEHRLGLVVGLPEGARHGLVIHLPLILLGVGRPDTEAAILRGPEPELEAELKAGLDRIEFQIPRREKRLEGVLVGIVGVAGEEEVIGTVEVDAITRGIRTQCPGRAEQGGGRA